MLTQMQELVARAGEPLTEPWNKPVGRPRSLGLYHAVEVACMYLRQYGTQEFLGDLRDIFQAAVSRIVTVLVPIIKDVLEEFVPDVEDAIGVVQGRVVLVDGAITPCWSYADHRELWSRKHGTTGVQRATGRPARRADGLYLRAAGRPYPRRESVHRN
jgi:hypothetical protein